MKPLLFTLLLSLSLPAQAAGPGDGGGTNLYEDELVDFRRFRETYGDVIQPMNPRKLRAKNEGTPVLTQVQPALDRLAYLYPGLGSFLDGAFKKPWVIVDKEFTARASGEKKVVSQTDDAVFVNLKWLQKASAEQLKQVFVHEAVRNWATDLAAKATSSGAPCDLDRERGKAEMEKLKKKYADMLTEEVTPLVYKKLQLNLIDRTANRVVKELEKELVAYEKLVYEEWRKKNPQSGAGECRPIDRERHGLVMYSREDAYRELRGTEPEKLIERICKPLLDSQAPVSSPERHRIAVEALDDILRKVPKEYILRDYDNRRCDTGNRLSYSDNIAVIGVVDITRYVGALAFPARGCSDQADQMRRMSDFKWHVAHGMNHYCGSMGNNPATREFLKKWKEDGGRLKDPSDDEGVEEVPESPAPSQGAGGARDAT